MTWASSSVAAYTTLPYLFVAVGVSACTYMQLLQVMCSPHVPTRPGAWAICARQIRTSTSGRLLSRRCCSWKLKELCALAHGDMAHGDMAHGGDSSCTYVDYPCFILFCFIILVFRASSFILFFCYIILAFSCCGCCYRVHAAGPVCEGLGLMAGFMDVWMEAWMGVWKCGWLRMRV